MLTMGEWLREELVAAGDQGICLADLHSKRKEHWEELGLRQVTGTYNSFAIFFAVLIRLGWVELTGVEEKSYIQRTYEKAPPRKYYRLTSEGLAQPEINWRSPIATLIELEPGRYPKARDGKYKRVYKPTGRRRGAPRMVEREEEAEPKPRGRPRKYLGEEMTPEEMGRILER